MKHKIIGKSIMTGNWIKSHLKHADSDEIHYTLYYLWKVLTNQINYRENTDY